MVDEDSDEFIVNILRGLIEGKIEEQKVKEQGISVDFEEAREFIEKRLKDYDSSLEEYLEEVPDLEEDEYLEVTREAMEIDRLYEENTSIGDKDLSPEEEGKIRQEYIDTLIRESEIGIEEEYFDLMEDEIEIDKKLRVKINR